MLHGNEEKLLRSLIESETYDIVAHGHTHKVEVYQKGKTLVVNPNELCRYPTGKSTLALIDTNSSMVKIIELIISYPNSNV